MTLTKADIDYWRQNPLDFRLMSLKKIDALINLAERALVLEEAMKESEEAAQAISRAARDIEVSISGLMLPDYLQGKFRCSHCGRPTVEQVKRGAPCDVPRCAGVFGPAMPTE